MKVWTGSDLSSAGRRIWIWILSIARIFCSQPADVRNHYTEQLKGVYRSNKVRQTSKIREAVKGRKAKVHHSPLIQIWSFSRLKYLMLLLSLVSNLYAAMSLKPEDKKPFSTIQWNVTSAIKGSGIRNWRLKSHLMISYKQFKSHLMISYKRRMSLYFFSHESLLWICCSMVSLVR